MMLASATRVSLLSFAVAALFAAGCSDEVGAGKSDVSTPDVPQPDTVESDGDDPDGVSPDATPEETAEEALTITGVLPGKGLTIGLEQVEITGTGFFQGLQVFFGESLAQDIFVLNDRRLVVLTPPRGPGLVEVKVVDPDPETGSSAKLDAAFLYYNPVNVVSVEPAVGHVLGGERVTVRGEGFVPGSVLIFGNKAALQVQLIDNQTITGLAPDGDVPGPVDVRVSNTEGVGLLEDGFTYVDAPAIYFVAPPTGSISGGNVIVIGGSGFSNASGDVATVMIGGQPLGNPRLVSPGRITGVVPAHQAGPVDISVTTEYGTGSRGHAYTYLDGLQQGGPVELLAVSPGTGRLSGGEQVMLVARGLVADASFSVRFGGVEGEIQQVDPATFSLIVTTPPGTAPGAVDVELAKGVESSMLADAFVYQPDLLVTGVSPASGPVAGGTAIEVSGKGFVPGLELRIGALAAASVQVVDAQTIRAVTPPGAPGAADVVVIQSGALARKENAFNYDAPYALWVVDPPQGAQAGGTLVTLVGSAFPSDARVTFGTRPASHVTVVSSTVITCKSPPGELGTVPVVIDSAQRGQVSMVDAFTYYDPTSSYGGTWGGKVEGDVNVTVLNGGTGAPVPDAFVMLWTDPRTPYQGFTNEDGQVTFSGADLLGEQMVSASKPGFSRASVVEYNATNVTVYINPTSPPSPGSPSGDPIPPAIVRGKITNLGKAFPVPFGKCDFKWDAPGNLCQFCTIDTDCGAGYRCSELPQQLEGGESGRYCTQDCLAPSDCPAGFMCVPLVADQPQQCAPKMGEITAYCDITNEHIFAEDVKLDPGIEVDSEGYFEFDTVYDDGSGRQRFGDMALYCSAGVFDDSMFQFVPLVLGVERHVTLYPGDVKEFNVVLDHPLNRTQYVQLDPVPRGPEGPDFEYIFPYIELAGDGVISLPPQYTFDAPFVLEHFFSGLTGDLYDATFTFLAGSFPFATQFPFTVTLHQRLTRLEDDTMFYLDAGAAAWKAVRTSVTKNVNGLFWAGENLVGVGSKGLVVRSVGEAWATQESGVSEDLRAVAGVGDGLVAVGDLGNITRYNGLVWQPMTSPVTGDLRSVWMLSENEGWAVGAYATAQMRNGSWTSVTGNAFRNLFGVYGFAANDVWAVGASGTVLRYDGISWNVVPSGTNIGLRAVWGASADDVWMVGEAGIALHWNGSELKKVTIDTPQTLTAIWGRSADDITVVGGRGVAFHWDGSAWTKLSLGVAAKNVDFLAIAGPPADSPAAAVMTGSHELVLGPILAVPESLSPGEGGLMGEDYRISWQTQPGPDPHFSYVEIAIPTMFGPVPEWTMINDFDVQSILLPDFPNIEGTPGIDPGAKYLTIIRVYKEGFDIDNYSNSDLNQFGWRSWSMNSVVFTKL